MRARSPKTTRARHNRTLERAEGFRGARGKLFRQAKETVVRADAFATRHRRLRKRQFRSLWITRLSAAARQHGLRYSRLVHGLREAGIGLNRKELSELAIHDPELFGQVCEQAKKALPT